MNARKRTTGRERIPKHLYVEKRKGQTRYRFTLIDGTKMLMPAEFSLDDIIAAANAYNDEHRPAQRFQISPRSRKDKFNRPMNEWLEHVMVRIKNEEELSAEILRQVSSDIARLN
ncbi:integrase, partial [Vibrio parahaemolyticus]